MDTLICVVDATTLVDHIHDIKLWTYEGRLRLVVPLSTIAMVEQLYQKSRELQPNNDEPKRPKSGGKPARKEYPAFDINPGVAREFLARVKDVERESVADFSFTAEIQKETEQYSPWKLLEAEEDFNINGDKKPASFAQALQKQSLEKLTNGSLQKGPMKPKLVARAVGNETSPWKTGVKALSLRINTVPKDVRPLLSCVLWRLHEKGATRWDTERTVLLDDNDQVTVLAKKLGIAFKSFEQLRKMLNIQWASEIDISLNGNLEKEFGVRSSAHIHATTEVVGSEQKEKLPQGQILNNDKVADIASSEKGDKAVSVPEVAEKPVAKHIQEIATSTDTLDEDKNLGTEAVDEFQSNGGASSNASELAESQKSKGPAGDRNQEKQVQNIPGVLPISPPTTVAKEHGSSRSVQPASVSMNDYALGQKGGIAAWVESLVAGSIDGNEALREPPEEEPVKTFEPLTYRQALTGKLESDKKPPTTERSNEIVKNVTPSPRPSPRQSPQDSPVEAPAVKSSTGSEDSDEEIVVFNPKAKRLSAQQIQRPQTPTAPPQPISHSRNASGNRPQSSRGKKSPSRKKSPPRPTVAPTIIDPDSFGRGFATNPHSTYSRTFSPHSTNGRINNPRYGNHRGGHSRQYNQRAFNQSVTSNVLPPPAPINPPQPLSENKQPSDDTSAANPIQPKPVRAEQARYSPRGSPRHVPINPEPEFGQPFILRSGTSRESTRGKGKLWVPS